MRADALIDTGAILAILNKADPWHSACVATVQQLRLPLLTSEAVLAEVFHMVGKSRFRKEETWQFIGSGTIRLTSIQHSELAPIRDLMTRYADLPMDFADATLVYLAGLESLETVLTVDQTDFSVYRLEGKRRFHVLPLERP